MALPSCWTQLECLLVTFYQEYGNRPCRIRLLESVMAERIETKAFIHQLALRMQMDDKVAAAWLEATLATLYDTLKAGKGVTFLNASVVVLMSTFPSSLPSLNANTTARKKSSSRPAGNLSVIRSIRAPWKFQQVGCTSTKTSMTR